MPPGVEVLTLEDIHNIVRDVWLTRHDEEIEAEKASRRKGQPKSVKQVNLEEAKLRESELYKTGMGEIK
jgi:translation machinery-associated protein 16